MAWSAQADGKPDEAVALMRAAADEEDAIEKLPVTPGPILPAREQLGDLLLEQNHARSGAQRNLRRHLQMPPGGAGHLKARRTLPGSPARSSLVSPANGKQFDEEPMTALACELAARTAIDTPQAQLPRTASPCAACTYA